MSPEFASMLLALGFEDIDVEEASTGSVYIRAHHAVLGWVKIRLGNHVPSPSFFRDQSHLLFSFQRSDSLDGIQKELQKSIKANTWY